MKTVLRLAFPCILFVFGSSNVSANPPINNVQVTLHGRKYDVSNVDTVQELQEKVQEASGINAKQQGRVLFAGKRLTSSDILSEVGVSEGAQINMLPGKTKTKSASGSSSGAAMKTTAKDPTSTSSTPSTSAGVGGMPDLEEMMKGSGLDKGQLDEIMKSMGGGGGKEGAPSMEESLEMMQNMMNSPIFQEYMSDPERLEQSRQMILQNPMLKSMMSGMPGMDALLNDPVAWREAMQAAASLYKNMDTNDLMKSMMGGMGGGAAGGLFDGTMDPTTTAALDELSEGDD